MGWKEEGLPALLLLGEWWNGGGGRGGGGRDHCDVEAGLVLVAVVGVFTVEGGEAAAAGGAPVGVVWPGEEEEMKRLVGLSVGVEEVGLPADPMERRRVGGGMGTSAGPVQAVQIR